MKIQKNGRGLLKNGNLTCKYIKKKDCKFYLIQSCFQERDNNARHMGFMAMIPNSKNLKEACDKLIIETNKIGRNCFPNEIERINSYKERRIYPRQLTLIISIIALITVITILIL